MLRLTLNDIQDILEQETDILESKIVIIPNEGVHSDADSGEEDEVDLSRLSRNQLLSSAESSVRKIVDGELLKISIGVPEDISEDDEHFEVVSEEQLALPAGEPYTRNLVCTNSNDEPKAKKKKGLSSPNQSENKKDNRVKAIKKIIDKKSHKKPMFGLKKTFQGTMKENSSFRIGSKVVMGAL
ncbi:hypothetical protein J6590_082754 [Homalodisca vitripennis]|nr:hypothetical protein J6590_082754 [Homalodisca vitripennis]